MKRLFKTSIIFFLLSSCTFLGGQTNEEPQTGLETQFGIVTLNQMRSGVLLEDTIDLSTYILGPGDIIGVNIVATDNMIFTLRVNPAGDLFLPTIGVVSVAGKTLDEATYDIQAIVLEKLFINADVSVTLVDIRSFKALVFGAVRKPGYITSTPLTRVAEIIHKAGGLQKYADINNIYLIAPDSTEKKVNLEKFMLEGDLEENPVLKEGHKVLVKFIPGISEKGGDLLNLTSNDVLVTGFVNRPGNHPYHPGYSVNDYLSISGGVHINGSRHGIELFRNDKDIFSGDQNQIVYPGDHLNIDPNLRYRVFGNYNIMQMITSFMSIYLSYRAATR